MTTDRRSFIKTLGLFGASAALFNPSSLFARRTGDEKPSGSRKMQLDWEDFTGMMKYTFNIHGSSRSSTPIVITRLKWDGYTGYGEASMPPYLGETQASCHDFLLKARAILDRFDNPFLIEDIIRELDAVTANNTAAKASVDIALHDLVGNIFGQPWWKIWGFNPDDTPYTCYTIGYDRSDEVVNEKITEASWNKIIKVKLGMGDKEDRRMINLIRQRDSRPIVVDANQGWDDKYYALDLIGWLKEQGVEMVEQPMGKYRLDDTAWITERSPIPVIADESCQRLTDILRLKGVFHGINIKLMKCTGLWEARQMITLAQQSNLKLMVGCMTETSVSISAAAQISPKMKWADLDGNVLLSNDCFDGMKLTDGRITLADRPGLGLTRRKGVISL